MHEAGPVGVSLTDTESVTVLKSGGASDVSFGEWLKRRRKTLGLTQQQLADQVGCSAIAIRKIESNERRASAQIVQRLAGILYIPGQEQESFLRFARGGLYSAPTTAIEDAPWRLEEAQAHGRIPIPLSSFVGREKETDEIIQALSQSRLVTLRGPGGVGKTRLAIEVANRLHDVFKDGVIWVELAGLNIATLVPQAVAHSLGLRELSNQPLENIIVNYLRPRKLLLALDNCEHLSQECARLSGLLLGACRDLRILSTSREALGVTGEAVWMVPAMSLPNPERMSMADLVMQYEGVRLFVERATAVQPQFKLSEENAVLVAQICLRLDGMPLAIELAAARTAMMSAAEIARRLDDRFNLLTVGSRAALPRHQTLLAAIDWSYDLLSDAERALFKRLSAFSSGFSLDAAEAVASGDPISKAQVTRLLGQLIDKSLVVVAALGRRARSETRYVMFETIHEYAAGKLKESGEQDYVFEQHARFFSTLAEHAQPKLKGAQQLEWLDRLEVEHDNLRVVLQRAQEAADVGTVARLAGALFWFWFRRSHLVEGRLWLERALVGTTEPRDSSARAAALYASSFLARAQGDFEHARTLIEQSIALWATLQSAGQPGLFLARVMLGYLMRDSGDPGGARRLLDGCVAFFREKGDAWNLAWSLVNLGLAIRDQDDYSLAKTQIEESLSLWRKLGDLWGVAESLHALELVAYRQGHYEAAYSMGEETLRLRRQLGDRQWIAYALHNLGVFALAQGELAKAGPFFDQDLDLFRAVGDRSGIALSLQYQGLLAHLNGDDELAQSILHEGLQLAAETGPRWISSNYLLWLADVASGQANWERAARLCSSARVQLAAGSSTWDAFERGFYERIVDRARAALGEEVFAREQARAQAWTQEQAIAFVLQGPRSANGS